jgi:putative transposase
VHLARVYGERKRNFVRRHFWAREYFRRQEAEDARFDQLNMWR